MNAVKTSKVVGRRKLRFNCIDDCVNEVDQILAAQANDSMQVLGNWKPGQILAHLAAWAEYPYNGYPIKPPTWPIRFVLKLMVPHMLKNGMQPGIKIPGVSAGTTGQEDQPIDLAATRYKSALERIKAGQPVNFDSPAFGKLSPEDVIRLQLRHGELHLSFILI